ncbi:MAG: pilin [Candidatus Dojkabacteria bacterium]|jgi:type IV secretory pathway VirB2 component (pilin)|nr:pilin [Candidatus Dojkabacteria bacterium]
MVNKLSKGISVLSTVGIMSSLFVTKVSAQFMNFTPQNYDLPGPEEDLMVWVLKVINWLIGASALVAVVMIVFSGFRYITAAGDENRISKATKTLTFAIVGLVLCFISGMIVNFVLSNILNQ